MKQKISQLIVHGDVYQFWLIDDALIDILLHGASVTHHHDLPLEVTNRKKLLDETIDNLIPLADPVGEVNVDVPFWPEYYTEEIIHNNRFKVYDYAN